MENSIYFFKGELEKIEKANQRDILKLIYLLSLFQNKTKFMHREPKIRYSFWLKEHALKSLIYYCINNGLFETYDYSPSLTIWGSLTQFVNTSNEAERDLTQLIKKGILQRLRLATPTYRYIFAYRLVEKESDKLINEIPEDIRKEVENIFKCPNCGLSESVFIAFECEGEKSEKVIPILYCYNCNKRIDKLLTEYEEGIDGILKPEDVQYEIEPVSIQDLIGDD